MNNLILEKDEISEEIIISKLLDRINELDENINQEDKDKIIRHSLAQISNIIDKISKTDSALTNKGQIVIPEYEINEDGLIKFKDPLLKKSNMEYNKESILNFLYNLCDTAANYGVKGVHKYYDYKQKYQR